MPQPRAEAVFKKMPWATTWPLRVFTYSWSLEVSCWSRSQQLLPAARFVSRYPLSPNLGIASTRHRGAHLTTLKIDSTAAHVHLSVSYHTQQVRPNSLGAFSHNQPTLLLRATEGCDCSDGVQSQSNPLCCFEQQRGVTVRTCLWTSTPVGKGLSFCKQTLKSVLIELL